MKNWSNVLAVAVCLCIVAIASLSVSTAKTPTYSAGNYDLGEVTPVSNGSNGGSLAVSVAEATSYGSNGATVRATASYGSNGGVNAAPVPYAEAAASYGSNGGSASSNRKPLLEVLRDRRAERLQQRASRVQSFGLRANYGSTGG